MNPAPAQEEKSGNRQRASGTLNPDTAGATTYTANALNPVHDEDGNMTSGPLPVDLAANAALVWDAENRLVAVTRADNTVIRYAYDHTGRRFSRQVGNSTATHYICDKWNPVAEYTGAILAKTYTWGTDLSGSMQGAGGVGGLLAVKIHTGANAGTYCPTYDGNGNISEYLGSNGTVAAHYGYDSFGNLTVKTGAMADTFAHRFSTKPLDPGTGLYNYGYRPYNPLTGRFPSRDPIEENGGENLYGFVGNNGLCWVDVLGLKAWMICNRCKGTQGPMTCILQGDKGKPSKPFTTNDPKLGGNRGKLPGGVYDIKPKPGSSMEPGNENLEGEIENGKVTGPGGTEYPVGTPSITGRFPNAIPGQLKPGGTTNYRIHGPGLSLGCITTGRCGDIQDMMEDHEDDGGMELRIYDVCCEKGQAPEAPAPRAIPVEE